jgi:hypothetical protein
VVPLANVRFDPTLRREVDAAVLERVLASAEGNCQGHPDALPKNTSALL